MQQKQRASCFYLASVILVTCLLGGCCKDDQVPANIHRLYSSDARIRNDAALALARCGSPKADKAVARLSELLYDSNVGVQSAAAYALRKIDNESARKSLERAIARRDSTK